MPRARVPERLVKKLTVMGSSGKMHGMSTAAKPPSSPEMNVTHSDTGAGTGAASAAVAAGATVVVAAGEAAGAPALAGAAAGCAGVVSRGVNSMSSVAMEVSAGAF